MLPLDPPLRRSRNPGRPIETGAWRHFSSWVPKGEERQVDYADALLDLQPHNLFAMGLLAVHARNAFEQAAILREAVRVGQRLWAPELSGSAPAPDWGGSQETLPFLTTVLSYAMVLMREGNQKEASQCLGFLLKLDPDDRVDAVRTMEEAGLILPTTSGPRMA